MKIVINSCFGGYSLSPCAIKELAKAKGKDCYFFTCDLKSDDYKSISLEEAENTFMWFVYSVPNPQDYRLSERDPDGLFHSANKRAEEISLDYIINDRSDSDLISIIERLGEKANGKHAKLKIVEIPDDVDYVIEDYDGAEHIAEKHRIWN